MDLTIGALVATALMAGAKTIGEEAVMPAFEKLKELAFSIAGWDAEKLCETPDSGDRARMTAAEIDARIPKDQEDEARRLANEVLQLVRQSGHGGNIDNSVTVIADNHGIAAGRDVNFGTTRSDG